MAKNHEEICCEEIIQVTTTMRLGKWVIGGVLSSMVLIIVCMIPIAYGELRQIQEAIHTLDTKVERMNSTQESLLLRFEDHVLYHKEKDK